MMLSKAEIKRRLAERRVETQIDDGEETTYTFARYTGEYREALETCQQLAEWLDRWACAGCEHPPPPEWTKLCDWLDGTQK